MADKKEIGTRIRFIRKELGMTQKAFAESLDVSLSYQNDIEKYRKTPSIDLILRIAKKYHVNTHYVLTGEGDPFIGQEAQSVENVKGLPLILKRPLKTEDEVFINKILLLMLHCRRVRYAIFEFYLGYEQDNQAMIDTEFTKIMEKDYTSLD